MLDGIRARSPRARVFVLNYPAIFPETGNGCFPQMPISFTDAPYLRSKQQELNAMIAAQAAANGARLVNWYAASIGKDACKGSGTRWVEPLIPGNWAASIHPNRRGMDGAVRRAGRRPKRAVATDGGRTRRGRPPARRLVRPSCPRRSRRARGRRTRRRRGR